MNKIKSLVCCTLLIGVGCETTQNQTVKYQSEDVLYKLGDKAPLNSKIEDDKWLMIASSENPTVDTIYANIAVGEVDSAITLARNYIIESPNDLDAFVALSRALLANKQNDLAAYYANYVLEKDPKRHDILNIIGLTESLNAKSISEYKKAKLQFAKSFKVGKSIAAGLNLGHLELETGALNAALFTFNEVKKACDDCSSAQLGMGITLRRLGKIDESISSLKRVSANGNSKHVANYHLALSLKKAGEMSDAREILNEIMDEAPSSQEMLISKTKALHQQIVFEMNESEI